MAAVEIITIETNALGNRSYVIVDGDAAAVVDPQRDIDRIETLLAGRRLHLTHVFETHLHNDYVTGGLELSRTHGATYVLAAEDEVAYEHTGARDGDEFPLGSPEPSLLCRRRERHSRGGVHRWIDAVRHGGADGPHR
jgi:glyoxylase-like metal-dependent hydrolase (beta-lactamase superfamily II)